MSYAIFMLLAFACAGAVARYMPRTVPLEKSQRLFIALAGFSCAVLFAKLPFWLLDDELLDHAGSWLMSGKTVLLGLVGGYLGVELAKWYLGITIKTGDYFVVPVAVGMGVGRLGCFFGGCCYGTPTELSWGVVFPTVDSLARHPTQLYECVFHFLMAGITYELLRRGKFQGQLIKLYFLSYFAFRFLTEFIRPEIQWTFGLTGYQWAAMLLTLIFMGLWCYDARGLQTKPTEQSTPVPWPQSDSPPK